VVVLAAEPPACKYDFSKSIASVSSTPSKRPTFSFAPAASPSGTSKPSSVLKLAIFVNATVRYQSLLVSGFPVNSRTSTLGTSRASTAKKSRREASNSRTSKLKPKAFQLKSNCVSDGIPMKELTFST